MKYFGTDGFRGEVSSKLNANHAFAIGQYLGYYFSKNKKSRMLIGKDTRISGDVLEHALASGAASMGVDVYLLGVTPTPVVSYLIRKENFDFGAMISASHNPYVDNGIKIFNGEGFKLEETVELLIEEYIDSDRNSLEFVNGEKIGRIVDIHEAGLSKYADWLHEVCPYDFSGMHVLVDLANGSATAIAAKVLKSYGAKVDVISNEPNGININYGCGSTHLDMLCSKMVEGDYDLGLAFDGDADRLLAVDDHGRVVDGDVIMYLCARYMHEHNELHGDTLVVTVMSNIGLHKALKEIGIDTKTVAVGDKYVSECLFADNFSLGGEQSGHIIFKDKAVTGDGLLTALHLLHVIKESGRSLHSLKDDIVIYPQVLKNVRVKDKKTTLNDEDVKRVIDKVSAKFTDNGRILVRPSGTEELIRVMVEAETDEICHECVDEVIRVIEEKGL